MGDLAGWKPCHMMSAFHKADMTVATWCNTWSLGCHATSYTDLNCCDFQAVMYGCCLHPRWAADHMAVWFGMCASCCLSSLLLAVTGHALQQGRSAPQSNAQAFCALVQHEMQSATDSQSGDQSLAVTERRSLERPFASINNNSNNNYNANNDKFTFQLMMS